MWHHLECAFSWSETFLQIIYFFSCIHKYVALDVLCTWNRPITSLCKKSDIYSKKFEHFYNIGKLHNVLKNGFVWLRVKDRLDSRVFQLKLFEMYGFHRFCKSKTFSIFIDVYKIQEDSQSSSCCFALGDMMIHRTF